MNHSTESPIVHEFGHALGLEHLGVGIEYVEMENGRFTLRKIKRNTPEEYEHAPYDINYNKVDGRIDLMGIGMGLRPFYFKRWSDAINDEKQGCDYVIQ